MAIRFLPLLLTVLPLAAGDPVPASSVPPGAATPAAHVIEGELVRVDLVRGALGVRPYGPVLRETVVTVAEGTRLTSRGRRLALADLRPGERVTISCVDDGSGHVARLVKMGARPAAVPTPR